MWEFEIETFGRERDYGPWRMSDGNALGFSFGRFGLCFVAYNRPAAPLAWRSAADAVLAWASA